MTVKFNAGLRQFEQGFLVLEHATPPYKILLCLYSEIQS